MDTSLDRIWEQLHHKDPDHRRQGIELLRSAPAMREALVTAVFTTPSDRFRKVSGTQVRDAHTLAAYRSETQHLWQTGTRRTTPVRLAEGYVHCKTDVEQFLHLYADGVLSAASCEPTKNGPPTALPSWLNLQAPNAFKDYSSIGAWTLQGHGLRLFSTCGYAVVLYQGHVQPDGTLHLANLSLYNGHRSTNRFTPLQATRMRRDRNHQQ